MDATRRGFLAAIGIGAAVAKAAPAVVSAKPGPPIPGTAPDWLPGPVLITGMVAWHIEVERMKVTYTASGDSGPHSFNATGARILTIETRCCPMIPLGISGALGFMAYGTLGTAYAFTGMMIGQPTFNGKMFATQFIMLKPIAQIA